MSGSLADAPVQPGAAAKQKKAYRPKSGCAAYALLVEMYFRNRLMTKEECGRMAQRWATSQIIEPSKPWNASEGFKHKIYDGWTSMKNTLEAKGLAGRKNATKTHNKTQYYLTDEGKALAAKIIKDDKLSDDGGGMPFAAGAAGAARGGLGANPMPAPSSALKRQKPPTAGADAGAAATTSSSSSSGSSSSSKRSKVSSTWTCDECFTVNDLSYERCASCNAEPNWFTSLTQIAGVATAAAAAASPYRTGKETRVIGCPVIGDVWGGVDQLSWDEARGPPSFYNREKYGHKPLHEAFYIVMCLDMQERDSLAQALEGVKHEYINDALRRMNVRMLVEFRALAVGDVLWLARSKDNPSNEVVLDVIAERKSVADLFSSLFGSQGSNTVRYWEQKKRIVASGISQRYYIVEGDEADISNYANSAQYRKEVAGGNGGPPQTSEGLTRTYESCISETAAAGFQILRTKDRTDTLRSLLSITRRICASPRIGMRKADDFFNDREVRKISFDDFQKKMTRRNVSGPPTVGDITEHMLYQIPLMGPDRVTKYQRAFPTIRSIVQALDPCQDEMQAANVLRRAINSDVKTKPGELEKKIFDVFGRSY